MDYGADLLAQDSGGLTALDLAEQGEHQHCHHEHQHHHHQPVEEWGAQVQARGVRTISRGVGWRLKCCCKTWQKNSQEGPYLIKRLSHRYDRSIPSTTGSVTKNIIKVTKMHILTCYCVRGWICGRYGGNLAGGVGQTWVWLRSEENIFMIIGIPRGYDMNGTWKSSW